MKISINRFAKFGLAGVLLACSSEDELTRDWIATNEPDPVSTGSLDITKYVAVGNSLTAGAADGALFPAGQELSYPSIVGKQFALAGGGEFNNPNVILAKNGTGRRSIDIKAAKKFLDTGEGSLSDVLVTADASPLSQNTVEVNNFGVRGARAIDIVRPGYGATNEYFGAFQSTATASVIGDATSAKGTFFSLWIGSNDVLGYALDGGTHDGFNPSNPRTITETSAFKAAVSEALDALTAGGATGVILTAPPVTTIPYFQVVTTLRNGVELIPSLTDAQANQLNGAFNVPFPSPITGVKPGYNSLIDLAKKRMIIDVAEAERRKVTWKAGNNAPIITDESLTAIDLSAIAMLPPGSIVVPKIRQASSTNRVGLSDLFPLSALNTLGVPQPQTDGTVSVPGVMDPLGDEFTLTEEEQIKIITAVAAFNEVIRGQVATRAGVHLVDLDPLFADVSGLSPTQAEAFRMSEAGIAAADGVEGREVSGINLVPLSFDLTMFFNSLFSADFIHPNPRGAALIANEIIDVVNKKYDADIPLVNPLNFPGINAPFR